MHHHRNLLSRHAVSGIAACLALALGAGACHCDQKEDSDKTGTEMHKTSSAMPVNTVCPVSRHAVDPDAPTRQYEGQTVGFCCDKCPAAWDKASVAERDAMMAKVAAK